LLKCRPLQMTICLPIAEKQLAKGGVRLVANSTVYFSIQKKATIENQNSRNNRVGLLATTILYSIFRSETVLVPLKTIIVVIAS
jgi:hypothetical protein